MVLPVRIELTTFPLPRECSTTELRQRAGLADTRSPSNWQAEQVLGGQRDTERGDIRLYPGREDPHLAQVTDQPGVRVAPEIFAERGLAAAGGAFPLEGA